MPTGMPSIASIGTVTAGAPRIEVGLLKTESPVLPRPRGAGPGEPRADQRFGQWGDRGEPVLRLLALQQAQAVIVKGQLTAGLEPFVKCVTVFAGILLDKVFEAPPVLPIADVRGDPFGICDAALEGPCPLHGPDASAITAPVVHILR